MRNQVVSKSVTRPRIQNEDLVNKPFVAESGTLGSKVTSRLEEAGVTVIVKPGVGRQVAATMLAEASRPLRARDYHTLRLYVGIAPVTKWSGKRRLRPHVQMRRACNRRLRQAAYHWARVSLLYDGPSRAYYDALRARGHTHGRALRSVIDRWFRILMAMLRPGTLYDPTHVSRYVVASAPG